MSQESNKEFNSKKKLTKAMSPKQKEIKLQCYCETFFSLTLPLLVQLKPNTRVEMIITIAYCWNKP